MAILMIDKKLPRLSFKCCGRPASEARQWDINLGGSSIGKIIYNDDVPHEGRNARTWNVMLNDCFDPVEFEFSKTQEITDRPYITTGHADGVMCLYNPQVMNMEEARHWVRSVVKKNMVNSDEN